MPNQLRFRRGTFADKAGNPLIYGEPYFNADIHTLQVADSDRDITLVAFPYSGSGVISGSLELTGSFTASLQKGYVWVGNSNNISTLVATSSFGGGLGSGHIILNSGSAMTNRGNLNFVRFTVTDDLANDATIVTRPPSVTAATSAPANPSEGDEWIDTNTWKKYMWFLNGAGTDYWVEVGLATPAETGSIDVNGFPFTGFAIITGSLSVSNAITASIISSSLFIGNGAGLYNISQSAIVGLNLSRITTGSISASVNVNGDVFRLQSGSSTILYVTSSNLLVGGYGTPKEKLDVSGSLYVKNSITASALLVSSSLNNQVIIRGSGSANPIMSIIGSQGQLFSITDSLSGSLFSVNDISGLPVLEVFSDNTTLMGAYQSPAMYTTTKMTTAVGSNNIYLIPTGTYDSAFFDYRITSGSNARAGQITAMVVGTNVRYTEFGTIDVGDTSGVNLTITISGSYMAFTGSIVSNAWTIKTIVRAI